jgi:IS6 family transposase
VRLTIIIFCCAPVLGFEAMAMIRKGQIRKIGGRDIRGQAIFITALFDTAA